MVRELVVHGVRFCYYRVLLAWERHRLARSIRKSWP